MITPDQLARGSEDGEQAALFCWAAVAERDGFSVAKAWADGMDLPVAREAVWGAAPASLLSLPVPQLKWLHAIPNGGLRDRVTAARLKATGVKAGVSDIFLPYPRKGSNQGNGAYHGFYLEMKRPEIKKASKARPGSMIVSKRAGELSSEQTEFINDMAVAGYFCFTAWEWRQAAGQIEWYLS